VKVIVAICGAFSIKGSPMRLPLIPPADLTLEQRQLYDEMRKGIASNFNAFKVEREDGALMGPWNPWLHEPAIGRAIWDLTLAMTANATLPDNVRQIAILVVGARFAAAYEIYAHIAIAEREKMKPERLATLVADLKPNDLAVDESVAFDVAYALVRGGVLPEPLYRLALDTFGQHSTNELIYLVGLYSLVSTTLNGFNVPVPERE
jgi:4-carboxymuconolactone decarboxylase